MKIFRVIINNFRSIKYLDFKPEKINLLIGGNNSGKTNILQALDFALNPYNNWHAGIVTEYDFYDRNTEERGILNDGTECIGINIEVWFSDFVNGEEHQNDWDICLEHINNKEEIISYDEESNEKAGKILRVTAECHADLKPLFYFTKLDVEKRPFTRSDKEQIGFHFIPAYRNPLYELSFYQNSFLSKLLESEELKEKIEKVIGEIGQSQTVLFEDEKFKENFESLQKSIQDLKLISSETGAMGLEPLGISERRTLQNFGLVFRPESTERPVPLKNQGLGAQNAMVILAILQTIEEAKHENLILVFEEPEQNLEPYYQRLLVKKLLKPATRNFQIFITSYSSEVIKNFNLSNIFLVQNQGIKHELLKISQEDTTLEWRKFLNHVEKRNKEEVISGILARFVLLVEGEAEKGGLPVFSQLSSSGFDEVGVELIWCEGIGEIPKYAEYFKRLNIPVIALCDKDERKCGAKQRNDIAKEANLTILWANYEAALLTSSDLSPPSKFAEICCSEYDFNENRDAFLKNTFNAEDAPYELKEFYEKEKANLKTYSDLEKLLSILKENNLLHCYQKFFLHNSLASVRQACFVAKEICKEDKKNIPPTICKLIALVIKFCEGRLDGNNGDLIEVDGSNIAKVIQVTPLILEIINE